ncbi:hypothetical protein D1872_279480 [compost metagenome]
MRRFGLGDERLLTARHLGGNNLADTFSRMIRIRQHNNASALLGKRYFSYGHRINGGASGLDRIRLYCPLDGYCIIPSLHHDNFLNHLVSSFLNRRHGTNAFVRAPTYI